MLSGLTGSTYINATGGGVSNPYINADTPVPAPARGAMRFNNGRMEVWDGNGWTQIYGEYGSVSLTAEAVEAINWVRSKIEMERHVERLAQDHEAVADALATAKESLDRLQVIVTLTDKGLK